MRLITKICLNAEDKQTGLSSIPAFLANFNVQYSNDKKCIGNWQNSLEFLIISVQSPKRTFANQLFSPIMPLLIVTQCFG